MTRFNTTTKGRNTSAAKAPTVNYEGAPAYTLEAKAELYALAVTSLLSDKFYATTEAELERLTRLVQSAPPEFTARLAIYCRESMWLRSIPIMLLAELAQLHSGDDLVRRVAGRVIRRVDELTETLSCYALLNPRTGAKQLSKMSHQLQLGLADAFGRFDEYQFSKWDGAGKGISLRDVMFLCHPKPTAEREALYKKIAANELGAAYTWESELSAKGNNRETWEALLDSGKVGYMALLRNLRNILSAGVSSAHVEQVCARLGNEEEVMRSRQFPFRFFSAARELSAMDGLKFDRRVAEALEQAMTVAAQNIKGIDTDDRVMLVCDISGSMDNALSSQSKVKLYEVGIVMASLLNTYLKNPKVGLFADRFQLVNLPRAGVLANAAHLSKMQGTLGGSTNGYLALKFLLQSKAEFDKVIFFTDCQWWDSDPRYGYGIVHESATLWAQYHAQFPAARGYYIDLAGYGTTPVRIDRATGMSFIAGWNERVFELVDRAENGSTAIAEIEAMEL
jgi:hypothetical protein